MYFQINGYHKQVKYRTHFTAKTLTYLTLRMGIVGFHSRPFSIMERQVRISLNL